jgi:ABC-type branched-subunit amino acid transport system permease subunit
MATQSSPILWFSELEIAAVVLVRLRSLRVGALMILAVPGGAGDRVRWFAFPFAVSGVYFSIITQALTYALMLAFFRQTTWASAATTVHRFQGHSRLRSPFRRLTRTAAGDPCWPSPAAIFSVASWCTPAPDA